MIELAFVLILAVVCIACLMEALKAVVEAVGGKVVRRTIDVPPYVWWILAGVLSALAVALGLHLLRTDLVDPAPLVVVATDVWAAFLWTPVVWWLQMQLDMKVIKAWILPRLQKLVDRKMEGM